MGEPPEWPLFWPSEGGGCCACVGGMGARDTKTESERRKCVVVDTIPNIDDGIIGDKTPSLQTFMLLAVAIRFCDQLPCAATGQRNSGAALPVKVQPEWDEGQTRKEVVTRSR